MKFPSLPRPEGNSKSPPTLGLINWAIKVYAFSLLCHFREMLLSFLFLVENGHVAASFVICRTLFEMAAQIYYVNKHVQQYLESSDLDKTRSFLFDVQQGSRYMRKYSGDPDYETSPHISKAIGCYNEFLRNSTETYSFLSEHAHPGPFAFQQHQEIDDVSHCILFVPPSRGALQAPLSNATISIGTVLLYVNSLLCRAGEIEIAQQLKRCTEDLVKLHKKEEPDHSQHRR